ncbi:MAG: hypothetical protein JW703_01995, partial [Candidatus Diapherotrites archaeon]|nr:hypothetical protein [Candidatus Diapherotrites archaeon]
MFSSTTINLSTAFPSGIFCAGVERKKNPIPIIINAIKTRNTIREGIILSIGSINLYTGIPFSC